jgi:hypothetical protein
MVDSNQSNDEVDKPSIDDNKSNYNKLYYMKNKETINEINKQRYMKNQEYYKQMARQYYSENKDKAKKYYNDKRNEILLKHKIYRDSIKHEQYNVICDICGVSCHRTRIKVHQKSLRCQMNSLDKSNRLPEFSTCDLCNMEVRTQWLNTHKISMTCLVNRPENIELKKDKTIQKKLETKQYYDKYIQCKCGVVCRRRYKFMKCTCKTLNNDNTVTSTSNTFNDSNNTQVP